MRNNVCMPINKLKTKKIFNLEVLVIMTTARALCIVLKFTSNTLLQNFLKNCEIIHF